MLLQRFLFCKSMDWFLYNRDLRHEISKTLFTHIHRESALTCCTCCSYMAFLSRIFTIHRKAGEGGGYLLISFLPLPPALHTQKRRACAPRAPSKSTYVHLTLKLFRFISYINIARKISNSKGLYKDNKEKT